MKNAQNATCNTCNANKYVTFSMRLHEISKKRCVAYTYTYMVYKKWRNWKINGKNRDKTTASWNKMKTKESRSGAPICNIKAKTSATCAPYIHTYIYICSVSVYAIYHIAACSRANPATAPLSWWVFTSTQKKKPKTKRKKNIYIHTWKGRCNFNLLHCY